MKVVSRIILAILLAGVPRIATATISSNWEKQSRITLTEGTQIVGDLHACFFIEDLRQYLASSSMRAARYFESKHKEGACGPLNGPVTITAFLGIMRDGDTNRRCVIQVVVHQFWGNQYAYTSVLLSDFSSIIRHCRAPQ